ncbi:hypothetical protein XENTR_v10018518 [Xenopus tropicalis]|nr:hypothetical protein XENTR_v10018518 [Xenopus tropicalis]
MDRWNLVLSDCSLRLMGLLIEYKRNDLTQTQKLLTNAYELLTKFHQSDEYSDLNTNLKIKLKNAEDLVMLRKIKKLNRDKISRIMWMGVQWSFKKRYNMNSTYRESRKTILKKSQPQKYVRFTSTDDESCGGNESTSFCSSVSSVSLQRDHGPLIRLMILTHH